MLKIVIVLIFLILFSASSDPVFAHDLPNIIHITKNGFEPQSLTINLGDTVTFENTDSEDHWPASNIHPTHEIYPEFDPKKPIKPGESWEFKFEKTGEWRLHDHLRPQLNGKIKVTGDEVTSAGNKNLLERISTFFQNLWNKLFKPKPPQHNFNATIQKDAQTIFANSDDLYSFIKKFGPKETVQKLHQLVPQFGDCHQKAHETGRLAYEIYGGEAFQKCSAECHSGCYHGATEAYFREHGTNNLTRDLKLICTGELNNFFSHQCIHGVGHGLMAYTDYDLNEALSSCDLLDKMQNSCWTGVFMENFVGGVTEDVATISGLASSSTSRSGQLTDKHITKFLNDDPQYPCNIVDEKYKSSCYFLQTSRMMQLFYGDFKKIADECSKTPQNYQRVCFESMGRDVSGTNRASAEAAIKACNFAPKGEMRIGCLTGAVQDRFWDPTGADEAIKFCQMLTEREGKDTCYTTIFTRAPEVLASKRDIEIFCQKAEANYLNNCLAYAR